MAHSIASMWHGLKRSGAALVVAFEFLLAAPVARAEEQGEPTEEMDIGYARDHFLVTYQPWMTPRAVEELYREHGTRALYVSPYGFSLVAVPEGRTPEEMAGVFAESPVVRSAQPDYKAYVIGAETLDSGQWNFPRSAPAEKGGSSAFASSMKVAVLDTGVNPDAGYLQDDHLTLGWDFVDGDDDPADLHGHGTQVARFLARSADTTGIAEPGFSTIVMPVRVLDDSGFGYTSRIAEGVRYSVENGAEVISIGLSYPAELKDPGTVLNDAIKYASFKGVALVAAPPVAEELPVEPVAPAVEEPEESKEPVVQADLAPVAGTGEQEVEQTAVQRREYGPLEVPSVMPHGGYPLINLGGTN